MTSQGETTPTRATGVFEKNAQRNGRAVGIPSPPISMLTPIPEFKEWKYLRNKRPELYIQTSTSKRNFEIGGAGVPHVVFLYVWSGRFFRKQRTEISTLTSKNGLQTQSTHARIHEWLK